MNRPNLLAFAIKQAVETWPQPEPRQTTFERQTYSVRHAHYAMALGASLYHQHRKFYGLTTPPWRRLDGHTKQTWIDRAGELLRDLEPTKCIYCTSAFAEPGSDFCGRVCAIAAEGGV